VKTALIKSLVLLIAFPLLDGCRRRKPEPTAPTSEATASSTPTSPATAQPAPGSGPGAGRPEPVVTYQVDAGLQQVLVKFYKDNQRPAMSWADLVGGKYIPSIPLGPDGKPLDWNTTMQRIGKSAARTQ
jgi:hypothetical protein